MQLNSCADLHRQNQEFGLWAKSPTYGQHEGQLLLDHLLDVCEQARQFLRVYKPSWPLQDGASFLRIAAYASLLHDFGKIHPAFQTALRGLGKFENRHEILSLAFLSWLDIPDQESAWLAAAIATHHKAWSDIVEKFQDNSSETTYLGKLCRDIPEVRARWLYDILHASPAMFSELGWPDFNRYPLRPYYALDYRANITKALETVNVLLTDKRSSGIPRPGQKQVHDWGKTSAGIHARGWLLSADHLASFKPQTISSAIQSQQEIGAAYPGIVWRDHQRTAGELTHSALLIAPTGSGKTEAALLWGAKQASDGLRGRFFIVLPYQASLNAMQKRLVERLQPQMHQTPDGWNEFVGLLHGRASRYLYELFLNQEFAPNNAAAQAKHSNELARLFASPIAVGTIFSIIRLLFATRGAERLWVSFYQARIVVDEIHAYDLQTSSLALATLQFLQQQLGARVLFMSATVPSHLQAILTETLGADLVSVNPSEGVAVRHRLTLLDLDSQSDEALARIIDAASRGSVLVVVNQVRRAILLWERLSCKLDRKPKLLHSRFHAKQRSEIESDLTPAPGTILVATQAVEVSLDLDFDCCFTELAPVESMVQRLGRCNRRNRQPQPAPAFVFLNFPAVPKSYLPYQDAHLDTVREALQEFCQASERDFGDADVQQMLERSYPEHLKQQLRRQIDDKISDIKKAFLDKWKPFGVAADKERRALEEAWEDLFDGQEVLSEDFVEQALGENTWLGRARYLVPISSQKFVQFRNDIEFNNDLACFVIKRNYTETGLDLESKTTPETD